MREEDEVEREVVGEAARRVEEEEGPTVHADGGEGVEHEHSKAETVGVGQAHERDGHRTKGGKGRDHAHREVIAECGCSRVV